MQRKVIGVFTAVVAALLLVGVAFASSDQARDESSSASATLQAGTRESVASDATRTSLNDNGGTTGTSLNDNGGTTNTTIDDHGGDDRDATTSTSIDGNSSTSTTVDNDSSAEQVTNDPKTYEVEGVGALTIQVVADKLVVLQVEVVSGWDFEVDEASARRVKVEFRNGSTEAEFEAELEHGKVKIEVKRD